MELERVLMRRTVREGYVLLLRAEAELLLPKEGLEVIREFYLHVAQACLDWVSGIYGEELRKYYLALSDIRERSRFFTRCYRFWMRVPWQNDEHMTVLCESERDPIDGERDFYRIAHTWNLSEQSILPPAQTMKLFEVKMRRSVLPFAPDGIYREEGRVKIFKNPCKENRFLEAELPPEHL